MKIITALLIAAGFLVVANVNAGVIIGGTRVIYDANKKESSLIISNPEKSNPYLIQTWIDCMNESNNCKIPFLITPPLFRLDAEKENILRILKVDDNLPGDKESVFWLNVKSISPTMKEDNSPLQLTVRTRIKLFYRPANLNSNDANSAYNKLKFNASDNLLTVENPTPYYVSFYEVRVDGKALSNPGMVPPKSRLSWKVRKGQSVSWSAINDYGGITKKKTSQI